MEDIKMTASKAQYANFKPELDAAFSAVMETMSFDSGPHIARFKHTLESLFQVEQAFTFASGTAALEAALRALELPGGAEVILPAFSYEGMAEVVTMLNLKPVFADVDPYTYTVDPASVKQSITPSTGAIIPVHLFGQCAPMQELLKIAEEHRVWIVEDSTQSLGAVYVDDKGVEHKAGCLGHIGVTAFFPPKPLAGEGDGGAVLTKDAKLANAIAKDLDEATRNVSQSKAPLLPNLQAALLDVKVKHIGEFVAPRQKVARFYDEAFAEVKEIQVPAIYTRSTHVYQQYAITVAPELREGLRKHLSDNYIPSAVYYAQPLHLLEKYSYLGYRLGDLPVAERLSQSILSLPIHSELKEDQLNYICQNVTHYVKQCS